MSISKGKLQTFKSKIRQFRKELNELAAAYETADKVVQINSAFAFLFKLSGN